MIYNKFDWKSLRQHLLLDGERVRIGKIEDVVDSADGSGVFVRVVEQSRNGRSMLIDTASIGIIGDGWAMLDQPMRRAGAFIHHLDDGSSNTDDEDEAYPEIDDPLEIHPAACPHCGSVQQAS